MLTLLKYLLILWAVIALGYLLAWWLGKRRAEPESGELSHALTFVGFSFGLLLALLLVFVTNHYTDARDQADSEATTLVAMFDDLGLFPPHVTTAAQHAVVCYMRSVIEQDWKAQERASTSEAPDTVVRGDRVRSLRTTLPLTSRRQQSAYGRVTQEIGEAGTARQQLLSLASPQIPAVLWAVVFVSTCVLMFLIVSESQSRPIIIQRAVLTAVILLLTFAIGTLATLDHPFNSLARVQPHALTRAVGLLAAGRQGDPEFRACGPPAKLS